ncbi:hypothetical protein C0J52_23722 [Blattella germanica]|nr:hypothetical protein C0J52_23722 [Blattella germanica]
MKNVSAGQRHRKKNVKKNQIKVQKTRKELRKEQRLLKKVRKNEYFQRKRNPTKLSTIENEDVKNNLGNHKLKNHTKESNLRNQHVSDVEKVQFSDKEKVEKLKKDMQKQRIKQLKRANESEDKEIKKLEKQLKLNKRKRKSIPKSFASDGLDFCEKDNLKQAMLIDQNLQDSDSEFEEDFSLMTGAQKETGRKKQKKNDKRDNASSEEEEEEEEKEENLFEEETDIDDLSDEDIIDELNSSEIEEKEVEHDDNKDCEKQLKKEKLVANKVSNSAENSNKKKQKQNKKLLPEFEVEDITKQNCNAKVSNEQNDESRTGGPVNRKRKNKSKKNSKENEKRKNNCNIEDIVHEDELESDSEEDMQESENVEEESEEKDEYWEDIYGRTRDQKGNVVQLQSSKYVPPHLRATTTEENSKKREQLLRLKKQMKGLLNRLAEGNMSSISSQVEELYMSHSRNDMNESLTNLLLESLVAPVITPERLIMEHAMLVAILHANVGTEVGAHILQTLVKKFDEQRQLEQEIENKELDNIVLILSHLYNFKVFNGILLYNILEKLAEVFGEKEVELILLILRNVGFSLRKDDPLALKDLILRLQQKAGAAVQLKNSTRVKFMLEVLLAIKNNNMTKIPNYDPSHIEHLKKLMKGFLRKGNYITELKISLEDLLKGENEKQDSKNSNEIQQKNTSSQYSQQLLELARKQRMNTDVRRNIFCIIMTAEMIVQCALWDKLKELQNIEPFQITNLAKFVVHLVIEKGLALSVLKVIHFAEVDKVTVRFLRQVILGLLLHDSEEAIQEVFQRVALSTKLHVFREGIRLFIHHFLLRNLNLQSSENVELLQQRAKMADKILSAAESKIKF